MPALARTTQPTLVQHLSAELDGWLAGLPSDQARYRELILQGNVWHRRYAEYQTEGRQPFGGPHPFYGEMDMFDFALLLADIEGRKLNLIAGVAA